MKVTRVIHPVGQGAFYTERIEYEDCTYNIVYDCGSGNRKKTPKRLERQIASYYKKEDVIDILFILSTLSSIIILILFFIQISNLSSGEKIRLS